jgi:hypothetical protein
VQNIFWCLFLQPNDGFRINVAANDKQGFRAMLISGFVSEAVSCRQ